MPRTLADILSHASEIAAEMHDFEPSDENRQDPGPLLDLRRAVVARANAENAVAQAVAAMRSAGFPWTVVGMTLGTSAEAARQRYGSTAAPGDEPAATDSPDASPAEPPKATPSRATPATVKASATNPAVSRHVKSIAARSVPAPRTAARTTQSTSSDYGLAATAKSGRYISGAEKSPNPGGHVSTTDKSSSRRVRAKRAK